MTIREHLESLIAELENIDGRRDADEYALGRCGKHAVAALALLDAAPIRYWERQYVDQSYAGVEMHGFNHTRGVWIPDPNHPFGSRDDAPDASRNAP